MRMKFALAIAALGLFCGAAFAEVMQEKSVTAADRLAVMLTVYQGDLALITDRRRVDLDAGENRLALRGVSARMRPESASLRSLTSPGAIAVRELTFDFDLLTPESLLERYIGRTVSVVKTHPQTGEETEVEAIVLAVAGGVVLRIGERIETQIPGRIVFPALPAGLRERPTLVVELSADAPQTHELELRYLSGGLSWQADYVAELSADGEILDLSGWVTLVNRSDVRYPDAHLQFVAGDVHRIRDEVQRIDSAPRELMAAALPDMRQEGFFDYHLYTLEHPVTVEENQTRQMKLLSADKVPVRREYLLAGQEHYYLGRNGEPGRNLPVASFIEFDNRADKGLGVALPGGVVRVYRPDGTGRVQFVGEDRIAHTPKGEKLRLRLGNAFDLRADRIQTDHRRLPAPEREQLFESAFRIEVRNAGNEEVTVTVIEPIPGEWQIIEESHPHEKRSAREALWRIDVPAEGRAVLEYRARVRF
jgi:hypothetical protein